MAKRYAAGACEVVGADDIAEINERALDDVDIQPEMHDIYRKHFRSY